jgi:hypothetical protein
VKKLLPPGLWGLLVSLCILPLLPARENAPDDFIVRGRVLVTYRGLERDVVIPPKLGIDRIGKRAFAGAPVQSVTVPVGVAAVEEGAFAGCSFLRSVSLPNTLMVLGRRAFFNCFLLENVNIPISLQIIEAGAFFNCRSLGRLEIPGSVKSIGARAFSGCLGLTSLSLSRRTRLGEHPFMGVRCDITYRN